MAEIPIHTPLYDWHVAKVGSELTLDIRGRRETAVIVELPFYSRKPKGNKK